MMLNIPKPMTAQEKLFRAAKAGDVAAIIAAIKEGAKPELANLLGNTALHFAADAGKLDAVNILLPLGHSQDRSNRKGLTPLHLAILMKHVNVVERLVATGSDILLKTRNHRDTPLHLATMINSGAIVASLLKMSQISDDMLKATNLEGKTALDIALQEEGHVDALQALLDAGAGIGVELNISLIKTKGWNQLKPFLLIGINNELSLTERGIPFRAIGWIVRFHFPYQVRDNVITNFSQLESAISNNVSLPFARLAIACKQAIPNSNYSGVKKELLRCYTLLQQRHELDALRAVIHNEGGYNVIFQKLNSGHSELLISLLDAQQFKSLLAPVILKLLRTDELKNLFYLMSNMLEVINEQTLTTDEGALINYIHNALHLMVKSLKQRTPNDSELCIFESKVKNIILSDPNGSHRSKQMIAKDYQALSSYTLHNLRRQLAELMDTLPSQQTAGYQVLKSIQEILKAEPFTKHFSEVVLDTDATIAASTYIESIAYSVFILVDARLATNDTLITTAKTEISRLLAEAISILKHHPELTLALKQITAGVDMKDETMAAATATTTKSTQVNASGSEAPVLSLHFAKPAGSASNTALPVNSAQRWQEAPREETKDSTANLDL